ncbi:MAG: exodeoxyribonuclease VII small subunit [Actinomycetia bacterium]|nr:exodeoxyribonuclease VII small subunit [Actinomycetes bacterium]
MAKEAQYETYEEAKDRLDQIVSDVRGKDVSLEASLDLLDEGVELANRCTELIDVASWSQGEGTDDQDEGPSAESTIDQRVEEENVGVDEGAEA